MTGVTQIQDGTGSGKFAKVNSDNQLVTASIMESAMCAAAKNGDAYSWTAVSADIDAGDTALCVVNRSQTRRLVIQGLYAWNDVANQLKVHVPAAATWAGTAVVGVNLNREYAATLADAVAYADETGTTFAAANTILTLHTNETATDVFACVADPLLDGGLVLGYDDAIAVDIISEPGAFECTIYGYYID